MFSLEVEQGDIKNKAKQNKKQLLAYLLTRDMLS